MNYEDGNELWSQYFLFVVYHPAHRPSFCRFYTELLRHVCANLTYNKNPLEIEGPNMSAKYQNFRISHLFQVLVHPLGEGLLLYGIPFI